MATKPRVIPAVTILLIRKRHLVLPEERCCGSVCAARSSTAHETSNRFTFEEILLHARTANDQVQPVAQFHSTAKKRHERIEANGQISHFEIDDADVKRVTNWRPSRRRLVPVNNSPVNRISFQSVPIEVWTLHRVNFQ